MKKTSMTTHLSDLRLYRDAYDLANEIERMARTWPSNEESTVANQIVRSSRSVCANIALAWRMRRHKAHFIGKLSDADAEVVQTQCWLDFALAHELLHPDVHADLDARYDALAGGLVRRMHEAELRSAPKRRTAVRAAHHALSEVNQ